MQYDRGGGRVVGYDIARALAILGMVVVHFSLVMADDHARPVWMAWVLALLDGRAAATFMILAGIGLTLLSRRSVLAQVPQGIAKTRQTLIRRGLFLLVLGFCNLAVWPGDILRVYGVSLIVAAAVVTASNRRLLAVASGFIAGFVLLFVFLDFGERWDWETLKYRGLWNPEGIARNLLYDGFRSVFPWTGLMIFGMWLGRLDLSDRTIRRRVLGTALVIALAAEALSRICVFAAVDRGLDREMAEALFGTQSMPALPLFLLAGGGAAVTVIVLCVEMTQRLPAGIVKPFAATGRMALTWYVAHIIFGLGAIVALGLEGSQSLPTAAGYGVAFFVLAVVLSILWMRIFRQGPLEACMRVIAG